MKAMLAAVAMTLSTAGLAAGEGLVSQPSRHSVPETLDRVEAVLRDKGVKIFARIDHAAEARAAGLELAPSQLLIFGNPKAGTPVMAAAPTAAIDLPLKALAWQDRDGKVWLSHNAPAWLARRHGIPDDALKPLAGAAGLLGAALK